MKALIITGLITIGSGVGIYYIGGASVLALSVLIPLFVLPVLALVSFGIVISVIGGAFELIGEAIDGMAGYKVASVH